MLVEGGLEAGGGHGKIRAGEREAGFGAEAADGKLIPRIKSENGHEGWMGRDGDGRVHKRLGREIPAGLIGVVRLVFVGGNIATKFPAKVIISC